MKGAETLSAAEQARTKVQKPKFAKTEKTPVEPVDPDALIEVQHLTKRYGDLVVLDDISEKVYPGEKVAIIGPSGGGKSTFLRCLNVLEDPTDGYVFFEGNNLCDLKVDINLQRRRMGMVFQQFNLFNNMNVLDNITLAPIHVAMQDIRRARFRQVFHKNKEAQIALEVGKVFDTEKTIVSYENLGIARLIYHLPTTLCETFLKEVFKKGSIESLDQETLFTIQKFFENNLNVSETSRKLFVHRNTLVYRLEKIKKLTGLDLREFDHAIVFKIALMVKKYLSSDPVKF